jgi:hypothetical protein
MNFFETKTKTKDDINEYMNCLKFKDSDINIKGSSIIKNFKYFGDYDVFTYVGDYHKYTTHIKYRNNFLELYNEFKKILNSMENINNTYLAGFKIGNEKGDNILVKNFNKKNFKNDLKKVKPYTYIQLEYYTFLNGRFIALTSDYYFTKKAIDKKIMSDLTSSIESLIDKGKYYKILKRFFNIYQLRDKNKKKYNKKNLEIIVDFFNSEYGKKYVVLQNIAIIIEIIKNFKLTHELKKLIKINLKNIGLKENMKLKDMEAKKEELENELNMAAKDILLNLIYNDF